MTRLLITIVVLVSGGFVAAQQSGASYATDFAQTENPISEGGRWINGQDGGLDWKNVRTATKLAFGTQLVTGNYDDSTALLSGTWGPNQTVQATVYTVRQRIGSVFEEVELRLRSAIAPHKITGYEVNFRCTHDGSQYVEIVRWEGPIGKFTYVQRATGPGLNDGDVISATINGDLITGFINGRPVVQGRDSTYAEGAPGMGFFLHGAMGLNAEYGFTSFAATDGPKLPSVPRRTARDVTRIAPLAAGGARPFSADPRG